jgi:soluble epoxide hydrolase / lipid-phosphate phosphatase
MPPPPPHIPTLLITPTLDPTNTPSSLERSKKWVPGLEVVPLEGVGHWALLERPKEVADIVGGFVGRCLQMSKAKF